MSFGYGVGDLIAVGKLALDIYEKFKYIQRDASKDFKDLMAEVSLLNANVVTLDKAIKEPESTLISGDIRKEMLDEMVQRMVQTLKELEAIAGKYDKQLSKQAAQGQALKKSRKEWWALFRWSLDASEVNALRGKFMYYNGIMTLLFASAANSSIQQVVAAQKRIESIVKQIETHVEAFSTSQIPGVTNPSPVINHSRYSVLKNPIINATLFQNAEVVDQWTGISIGQWIHAGRWWLLKSQSRNRVATSTQNYVDLIKAAWIFIVLIKAHPQFNSIQPELLVEVEVLGEAITQKFDALEKKSFIAPEISVVRAADLRIWEVDKRDASVQPLDSGNDHSAWGTKEHFVLAQHFAKYSNSEYSTPCILLFVGSKADHKEGAVVISDQKGVTIFRSQLNELFPETTTENDAANGRFWITVGSLQRLEFETEIERCYVMAIWTAVYEYLNHCRRVISPKEAIHALASLATNVYVTLSPAKSWGFSREISTKMTPACALRDAIKRHTRARDWGTLSKKYNPLETSLLTWAGGQSHADIVLALLQYKVDPGCVPTAVGAWMDCTLLTAAGEGNVMMFQVLLNENRRRRLTITAELHQWPVRMHKRHRAFAKYQRWSSPTTANLSYGGPCEWQTRYRNVDVGIRADEDHYGGMEGPSDVLREQDKSWSFAKKKDQELRPLSDMVGMLFVAGRGGSIKVVELVRALLKTDRKRLNDISGISGVEEDSSRVEAMLKHAVVDGNKAGHDDDDTIMTGAVDGDRPEIIRHFLPDYLKTLESQWPKGPSSICHVCEWLGGMYLNVAVVCGRTRAAKALVTTAQSHAQKHDTQSIGELVTEDNVLVFACRIAAGVDIHAVYTDPRGGSDITALEMASRAKSYKIADYLNIIHFQGQRVARDPE